MARRALTLTDVVVVMLVVLGLFVLLSIMGPFTPPNRIRVRRAICAQHLSQIGKGLFAYAAMNADSFPRVTLVDAAIIGEDETTNDISAGEDDPFTVPAGTDRSVSQNLWLLCREGCGLPIIFICPSSDELGQEISEPDEVESDAAALMFSDFPWGNPKGTISYSFVQPWTSFGDDRGSWQMWNDSVSPGAVLAADANNGSDPSIAKAQGNYSNLLNKVNSRNHNGEGQNVLYGGGNVLWRDTAYCGDPQPNGQHDNIYTSGAGVGTLDVQPTDLGPSQYDTVLIPPSSDTLKNWQRNPNPKSGDGSE